MKALVGRTIFLRSVGKSLPLKAVIIAVRPVFIDLTFGGSKLLFRFRYTLIDGRYFLYKDFNTSYEVSVTEQDFNDRIELDYLITQVVGECSFNGSLRKINIETVRKIAELLGVKQYAG